MYANCCNSYFNKAEMLVLFPSTLLTVELKLHFAPSTPFTLYTGE